MKRLSTPVVLISVILAIASVSWAQSPASTNDPPHMDNELVLTIVSIIVGPAIASLLAYWTATHKSQQENQWTVATETRNSLRDDRDEARKIADSRAAEIDKLQDQLRESTIIIARMEGKLSLYRYRLGKYEPVTGPVNNPPSATDL